jgi:DNA-binding HxlR family transcriptional regulator
MNEMKKICNDQFEYDYVKKTLDIIGGKWKAAILWNLRPQTMRFNALLRSIPKISHKMLTQQLRELERDHVIKRTVFDDLNQKVEYSFTEYGKTLCSVFLALEKWGEKHNESIKQLEE